jgi:hypothetical protein
MVSFKKFDAWSLISTLGHLNLVMAFSKMKWDMVYVVQYLTCTASSHLVRYSVVVII